MPIVFVVRALFGLLSWLILAAAAYLLWSWSHGQWVRDAAEALRHVHGPQWRLYAGLALLAWSFLGRVVVLMLLPAGGPSLRGGRGEISTVTAPDGSVIHVESFGPPGAPPIVLTHGWGLNATSWGLTERALAGRFRLILWDLPGLGRSKGPTDGRYTLERLAEGLSAVLATAAGRPAVLVGHSIGGMITQTYLRDRPTAQAGLTAGAVLIDTSHRNPIDTMIAAGLWRALRRPVIEPMLHLTIWLSPLVWLSSWKGYLDGSSQIATRLTGFGRHGTREQVDYAALLSAKNSPAVLAKGDLAMFRWSGTEALPGIADPLLVIVGDKDIVTLPNASRFIAEQVPRARLQLLSGGGHMTFMELHAGVNTLISDFADTVMTTPADSSTI